MPAPSNPMQMAQLYILRRFSLLISLPNGKKNKKERKNRSIYHGVICRKLVLPRFDSIRAWGETSLEKSTAREGRSLDVVYKGAPDIKHLLMRESGLDRVCNNGFFASLIVQNVCAYSGARTPVTTGRGWLSKGGQEACIESGI